MTKTPCLVAVLAHAFLLGGIGLCGGPVAVEPDEQENPSVEAKAVPPSDQAVPASKTTKSSAVRPNASKKNIDYWVRQLDHDLPAVRTHAKKKLRSLGVTGRMIDSITAELDANRNASKDGDLGRLYAQLDLDHADAPLAKQPQAGAEKDVNYWIGHLGHPDSKVQADAEEQLLKLGREAIGQLTIASENRPLDVRLRSGRILNNIYSSLANHVDISAQVNHHFNRSFGLHSDNHLGELPRGEQVFAGVRFYIGDGCLVLGSRSVRDKPRRIEKIKINAKFDTLDILHATQYGNTFGVTDGHVIARYLIHYEDDGSESIPVAIGEDVRDWWNDDRSKPITRGGIAWTGSNSAAKRRQLSLRLYLTSWKNPRPDKKVTHIDFVTATNSSAAAFCVAMTMTKK